jgi:hypothetical protein
MTADPLVFNKQATEECWTAGAAEHCTPKNDIFIIKLRPGLKKLPQLPINRGSEGVLPSVNTLSSGAIRRSIGHDLREFLAATL